LKTIGIIGGMSYESTAKYYSLINEHVKNELGGLNSARILICSVNFDDIANCQKNEDWVKAGQILGDCAKRLEKAGADYVLLATNTMHIVADAIQNAINIPFIHIGEVTAQEISCAGYKKAGILATKFTLESDVYKEVYAKSGVELIIPEEKDRILLNTVIFEELCKGDVKEESRAEFQRICKELQDKGAECIILGCTEIMILIGQKDVDLPVFDTTFIHTVKAAELALDKKLSLPKTERFCCSC